METESRQQDMTDSRRKGLPWQAATEQQRDRKEAEKAGSGLWAGDGGRALGESGSGVILSPLGPAAEGRLHEFLVESINRTALLSPATFFNDNQFINITSPSCSLKPRLRKGNHPLCFSEVIPNLF